MTVDEEGGLLGLEKSLHLLVLARLLQKEPVVGLVLLVSEHGDDVDNAVVAVLRGEDVHDPLPPSLHVASVQTHDLHRNGRDKKMRGSFGT